jgi:hypothetical protein
MATIKVIYEMPTFGPPKGWIQAMAVKMQTHPNTISNIRNTGKSHPRYKELVENVKNTYGKPIKLITPSL